MLPKGLKTYRGDKINVFNNLQVREAHTMGNESKENKITDDRDMRTLCPNLKYVGLAVLVLLFLIPTFLKTSALSAFYYRLFLISFFIVIMVGMICLRNQEKFWRNYIYWTTNIYFASLGSMLIVFEGSFGFFVFICLAGNVLAKLIFNYFVLKKPGFSQKLKEYIQEQKPHDYISSLHKIQFVVFFVFYGSFSSLLAQRIELSGDSHYYSTLDFIFYSFILLVAFSIIIQNSCKGIPETIDLKMREFPMWFRWMLLQYAFFVLIRIFLIY